MRLTAPSATLLMGRSHGFGSTTILLAYSDSGFPAAPSLPATLASYRNSPVHSLQRHALTVRAPAAGLLTTVSGGYCFTLLRGAFSPFHGTGSLSVTRGIWGWEMVLPDSRQDFTCPAVLRILLGTKTILNTRLLLSLADLPKPFFYSL